MGCMMKLALIPPIDLLDRTCETQFQLMLPHLIYDERYAYTYRAHCRDPRQYVILDNGEAEGETIPVWKLASIAMDFGVNEIVLPDTIGNMLDTMEKAEAFIDMATDGFDLVTRAFLEYRTKFMFVVQGQNLQEFKE